MKLWRTQELRYVEKKESTEETDGNSLREGEGNNQEREVSDVTVETGHERSINKCTIPGQ